MSNKKQKEKIPIMFASGNRIVFHSINIHALKQRKKKRLLFREKLYDIIAKSSADPLNRNFYGAFKYGDCIASNSKILAAKMGLKVNSIDRNFRDREFEKVKRLPIEEAVGLWDPKNWWVIRDKKGLGKNDKKRKQDANNKKVDDDKRESINEAKSEEEEEEESNEDNGDNDNDDHDDENDHNDNDDHCQPEMMSKNEIEFDAKDQDIYFNESPDETKKEDNKKAKGIFEEFNKSYDDYDDVEMSKLYDMDD